MIGAGGIGTNVTHILHLILLDPGFIEIPKT